MSFTYAELKTAIQDYTDNSETTFVNHLNDFIKALRIYRGLLYEIPVDLYVFCDEEQP